MELHKKHSRSSSAAWIIGAILTVFASLYLVISIGVFALNHKEYLDANDPAKSSYQSAAEQPNVGQGLMLVASGGFLLVLGMLLMRSRKEQTLDQAKGTGRLSSLSDTTYSEDVVTFQATSAGLVFTPNDPSSNIPKLILDWSQVLSMRNTLAMTGEALIVKTTLGEFLLTYLPILAMRRSILSRRITFEDYNKQVVQGWKATYARHPSQDFIALQKTAQRYIPKKVDNSTSFVEKAAKRTFLAFAIFWPPAIAIGIYADSLEAMFGIGAVPLLFFPFYYLYHGQITERKSLALIKRLESKSTDRAPTLQS